MLDDPFEDMINIFTQGLFINLDFHIGAFLKKPHSTQEIAWRRRKQTPLEGQADGFDPLNLNFKEGERRVGHQMMPNMGHCGWSLQLSTVSPLQGRAGLGTRHPPASVTLGSNPDKYV